MRQTGHSKPDESPGQEDRPRVFALLLAAGTSSRYGSDKLATLFAGKPVWLHSYMALQTCPCVDAVGIVGNGDYALANDLAFVVPGGSTRQESSEVGCRAVPTDYDIVIIHDAARPFVSQGTIQRVVQGCKEYGAAFAAVPVTDTVHLWDAEQLTALDREHLWAAQTPQGARREWLLDAFTRIDRSFTDEASLLAAAGYKCVPVLGDPANKKITHFGDLVLPVETRTGFGYDVHRFSADPSRPMWLGGVEFDERPGLEGHSDADALLHAMVDALLGAAGLGDIGVHFPPSDPQWKDCRSTIFLQHAQDLLSSEGWTIINVDATVVAERPKVMPRASDIREVVGAALGIGAERVSVKATTNEGLGSIGSGEGLAAYAVATIQRPVGV